MGVSPPSGLRHRNLGVVYRAAQSRLETPGLFKVVEINHPLVLSLSKDGRRWFDKLTMSGGRRTLKWPCLRRGPNHTPFTIITFDSVALILNSFGPA